MKKILSTAAVVALAGAVALAGQAPAPPTYAIRGAKIVPVSGAVINSGNIVLRNGLIEAVGASAAIPADAIVIDGKGLTVYPGLIDMGNATPIAQPEGDNQPQGGFFGTPARPGQTREDQEREKRERILRANYKATEHLRLTGDALTAIASTGVTTVLATPPGAVFRGQSALVNVVAAADSPQIGAVADIRSTLPVIKPVVATHVGFNPGFGPYPGSLMGAISFVRQSFIDAAWQRQALAHYEKNPASPRPAWDPLLQGLLPAIDGQMPVAFVANQAREIGRVLSLAKEFNVKPVVTGAREADAMTAELKAANTPVIYSLNYPTRPRTLAPDAEESLDALRTRANAPKVPAALAKAGVLFAFESDGLRQPGDFVRNAAKAVHEGGLPADAALRALTLDAARIAGAERSVGSLEPGKIANIVITDGDLFDEKSSVKYVFVDGHKVAIAAASQASPARRGNSPD